GHAARPLDFPANIATRQPQERTAVTCAETAESGSGGGPMWLAGLISTVGDSRRAGIEPVHFRLEPLAVVRQLFAGDIRGDDERTPQDSVDRGERLGDDQIGPA